MTGHSRDQNWQCHRCGTINVIGVNYECGACRANGPIPPAVTNASSNPPWTCSGCGSWNSTRPEVTNCPTCGMRKPAVTNSAPAPTLTDQEIKKSQTALLELVRETGNVSTQ